MCHYVTLKIWGLQKNVTFDSADWSWLLYKQGAHTQLLCAHTRTHTHTHTHIHTHIHTHTHTHTLAVQDPLCVCHYHTSGSHWGPPTPENACRTTIYRLDHLEMPLSSVGSLRAVQSVSHDAALVLMIHRRKPLGGMNNFLWGRVRVQQPHPSFCSEKSDHAQRKLCLCQPSQALDNNTYPDESYCRK